MSQPKTPSEPIKDTDAAVPYMKNNSPVGDYFYRLPPNFKPPVLDPDNCDHWPKDATVVYQGSRGSGKTTLCTEMLLRSRKLYPYVFVWSKTWRNNWWQQFVPEHKLFKTMDEGFVKEVLDVCGDRYSEYKAQKVLEGRASGNPLVEFVYEDMVTEGEVRKSTTMHEVFFNARHSGVGCSIMTQTNVGLDPGQRDNVDVLCLFKTNSPTARRMLLQQFGPRFLQILDETTEDGSALIVFLRARTPLEHMLYRYKADRDWVMAQMNKGTVLGNKRCWGDTDPREQKRRYPYLDQLPARATLEARFNEAVGERAPEIPQAPPETDEKKDTDDKKKKDEPKEDTWEMCLLL